MRALDAFDDYLNRVADEHSYGKAVARMVTMALVMVAVLVGLVTLAAGVLGPTVTLAVLGTLGGIAFAAFLVWAWS